MAPPSFPPRPRFTEDEIFTAIKAAQRAGVHAAVEVTPEGAIRIILAPPSGSPIAPPDFPGQSKATKSPPLRDILKIDDVAKHWGVSSGWVRKAVERGDIAHFRVGTLIRIKREEIERIDQAGGIPR